MKSNAKRCIGLTNAKMRRYEYAVLLFWMDHALDELGNRRFEYRQRFGVDIHHMAGVEIFHVYPVFEPGQNIAQMIDGVFSGEERSCKVEISVQHKHIQVRVLRHDVCEIVRHVGIPCPVGLPAPFPIPLKIFVPVGFNVVCLIGGKFQVFVIIIHKVCDEHWANG